MINELIILVSVIPSIISQLICYHNSDKTVIYLQSFITTKLNTFNLGG
ncbi:hypothetical protein NSP_8000 [Nodularia spumigena CCY9414]|nr:hypothetical protein NSP_8000 [Nodularia spumigena CCY9414]